LLLLIERKITTIQLFSFDFDFDFDLWGLPSLQRRQLWHPPAQSKKGKNMKPRWDRIGGESAGFYSTGTL
jgi:hypothetical protein